MSCTDSREQNVFIITGSHVEQLHSTYVKRPLMTWLQTIPVLLNWRVPHYGRHWPMTEVFDLVPKSLVLKWDELLFVTVSVRPYVTAAYFREAAYTENLNLAFRKLVTQDICPPLAFLLCSPCLCTYLYHPPSLWLPFPLPAHPRKHPKLLYDSVHKWFNMRRPVARFEDNSVDIISLLLNDFFAYP